MTTSTKVRLATAIAATVDFSGRGKTARIGAFMLIAPLSFAESQSRAELIGNLATVLGGSPTEAQQLAARNEFVIGRVASRMPAAGMPKGKMSDDDRLIFAREVVLHMAAPPKPGAKERPLRAHQTGRRSALQHKVVRAAEEAWSMVKAELGIGNAQTQKAKDAKKKTRGTDAAGPASRKADAATATALATPAKALTADEATQHVVTQAAALLAFSNKHAKLLPLAFGEAVIAFKNAINKAANDYATSKATKQKD